MNKIQLKNHAQEDVKKAGRKVNLALTSLSPEDRLNSIADIIIERVLEVRSKNTTV
ncbi:MAG: hypothetical protein ACREHC_04510 [Candidatus Levyibacteriota bacterium]